VRLDHSVAGRRPLPWGVTVLHPVLLLWPTRRSLLAQAWAGLFHGGDQAAAGQVRLISSNLISGRCLASLPSRRRSVAQRRACAGRLHGWRPCRRGRLAADGQVSLIPKLSLFRSATRHLRLHVYPTAALADARRERGSLGLPQVPLLAPLGHPSSQGQL
jgi:hypothetical protein